ncbi:MAG: apolipoprotein N-acyltransferase [Armatimonadetes bacterium]|nr:apolipoprotein N-acyltransferase [Armatimonadota bacterium]
MAALPTSSKVPPAWRAVSIIRAFFLLVAPWRVILSLTSGFLLAFAFPPYDVGWLAWVALVPLLVAVRDLRPGGGWVAGLIAGTVFFALLMGYIGQFGVLPWLALAVFQGLFVALYGYLAALMWRCPCAWLRIPALAACWTASELIRGHLGALQFTFGALGYSQHAYLPILQLASLVGHSGLGFVIALFAAALVEGVPRLQRGSRPATGGPLVILVGALLIALVWGSIRERSVRRGDLTDGLEVVAVQGDVTLQPQTDDFLKETTGLYVGMSLSAGLGADLIVWPETAIPARLNEYPDFYRQVRSVPQRLGCTLLAGAAEAGPRGETYNTLWAFDREGRLISRYRKQRLVVFGEYLPWRDRLKFLMRSYPIRPFDFSPGAEDVLVPVDHALLSPMICFESIFPDISRRLVAEGAEILVVSTSDVWVGRAPAELRQHSQASVLRAVETGRWLIRAGGTGVTCIIDPAGRIVASAPMFENTSIRARIRAETRWTPYDVLGDWPLVAITCLLLLGGLADIHSADLRRQAAS